ncbi:MAG: hypothetical protein J7J94_03065 [Thaumarchaeota archaeon]|nr:hypothetical protein [Nitrososphaerota archaeon]
MEGFSPPRRRIRLDVLIPSSYSRDSPHPRDRMIRLGLLARALAAARAETLIIYHEDPGEPDTRNAELVRLVMDYLNTAPYLRRRVYKLRRELRYAGVLPPLNIPTHPEKQDLDIPHYREGLVISAGSRRSVIEAGLGKPIKVRRRLKKGSRVVLRVEPGEGGPRIEVLSRRRRQVYSGFKTAVVEDPLPRIVEAYDLRIAASRKGRDVREVWGELGERLEKAGRICVAFGASREGLYEIAGRQGFDLEKAFDYVLNTFPGQGVRTIRVEEAVAYTLAILNLLMS